MEFKKYNSIENSYRDKFVQKIYFEGKHEGYWCVTEKIHGANFSFITNGTEVKVAKRTSFTDDDFSGAKPVIEKLTPNILKCFNEVKFSCESLEEDITQIHVYGELCGGSYPHEEVEANPQATRVQKGVWYSPNNEFVAFDIYAVAQNKETEETRGFYVNYHIAEAIFIITNIPYCEPLFRGSLKECMDYPNDLESAIYKLFKLPPIKDNIMEGVVIKPFDDTNRYLFDHSRVILKNKNEKFTEKSKEKNRSTPRSPAKFDPELKEIYEDLEKYITRNRFDNLVSKIGSEEVSIRNFGKILGEFSQDALGDFNKDNNKFGHLDKKRQRTLTKIFNKDCALFLKPIIMKEF